MWQNPQGTEEIFNGKLHFLCNDALQKKGELITWLFSAIEILLISSIFMTPQPTGAHT